jgi:SSS family solute:Na+ symporter
VMIMAAGSTLDSTFSSVAKSIGQELPLLAGRAPGARAIAIGMWTMLAFAVLGNLPMIAGTDILKATTVSGTMVMGLAPIFLLAPLVAHSPWSFHLAFWPGVALGILLAAGAVPPSWAIGTGKYALLLGVNLYGLAICFAGFLLPVAWQRLRAARGETR